MDPSGTPGSDEVRAQLGRVLAAGPLANAGRLSRLLSYVVERTLAGEGEQLKEYVLGTEVFDRSPQYDPRIDSIVRVEARRLRAKLEEYYQGPGADDAVIIDIPRGSYVPVFRARGSAPTAEATTPPISEAPPITSTKSTPAIRFMLGGAFLAGAVAMMVFAGLQSREDAGGAARASSIPSIAVLPFQHYSSEASDAQLAARVTDALTTELARLGTVAVASRTSAARYTGDMRDVKTIARTLAVDFIVEASAVTDAGGLHAEARLVDGVLDRKVWVGTYDAPQGDVSNLAKQMAADISTAARQRAAAVPPQGPAR
jgi:TolB-like protein